MNHGQRAGVDARPSSSRVVEHIHVAQVVAAVAVAVAEVVVSGGGEQRRVSHVHTRRRQLLAAVTVAAAAAACEFQDEGHEISIRSALLARQRRVLTLTLSLPLVHVIMVSFLLHGGGRHERRGRRSSGGRDRRAVSQHAVGGRTGGLAVVRQIQRCSSRVAVVAVVEVADRLFGQIRVRHHYAVGDVVDTPTRNALTSGGTGRISKGDELTHELSADR